MFLEIENLKLLIENEISHAKALQDTGFWGTAGAGCIILAKDSGNLLLPFRSRYVEQPNTWGTWGGAIDTNENPSEAAKREVFEESGYGGKIEMIPLYVFKHESGFKYYNYLAVVEHEFTPRLNWETENFGWFNLNELPSPLHFGLSSVLNDQHSLDILNEYSTNVKLENIIKKIVKKVLNERKIV